MLLQKEVVVIKFPTNVKEGLIEQELLFNDVSNYFIELWNQRKLEEITYRELRSKLEELTKIEPHLKNLSEMLRKKVLRDSLERFKSATKRGVEAIDTIPSNKPITIAFNFDEVKRKGDTLTFALPLSNKGLEVQGIAEKQIAPEGFVENYKLKRTKDEYVLFIHHVNFKATENLKPIVSKGIEELLSILWEKGLHNERTKHLNKRNYQSLIERIHTVPDTDFSNMEMHYNSKHRCFFVNLPLSNWTNATKEEQLVFRFYPNIKKASEVKLQFIDVKTNTNYITK
ncbi:hypothetical protein bcgnr5372_46300 [Bacillus luti]|nr:hypothetical protein [Bacillus cereus]HDR8331256.1 hypothetical protein [Bacillus cereus]HDR8336292.1 hypothetical protein [Bacillus cereus]